MLLGATVGNGGRYATDVASLRRALNEAAKEDANNTEQYSRIYSRRSSITSIQMGKKTISWKGPR